MNRIKLQAFLHGLQLLTGWIGSLDACICIQIWTLASLILLAIPLPCVVYEPEVLATRTLIRDNLETSVKHSVCL